MNAWFKIGMLATYTVLVFFTGWHIHTWEDGYKATYQLEEAVNKSNAVDTQAQETLTNDRAYADKTNTEAEHEVSTTPMPCKLPSSWVHTYNEALSGSR